jgi:TRAP-type transport system small permease protein
MSVIAKMQTTSKIMARIQRNFLFYLLMILTLAMLVEILSRFFLNKSVFGLSDFIGYSSVWLYAIGASYATFERTHIKAEFLSAFLSSDRARHLCRLMAAVVSTVMAVIFTKWSYELCAYSIQIQEKTHAYPVPKVIFQTSFFIGGILMTIYFIAEIISHFIAFKKNKPFIVSEVVPLR